RPGPGDGRHGAAPGRRTQGAAGLRPAAATGVRLDEGRPAAGLPRPALPGLGPGPRCTPAAALGPGSEAPDRQAFPRPGPAPAHGPRARPAPGAAGAGRAGLGAEIGRAHV